jgi:hypothetical protein
MGTKDIGAWRAGVVRQNSACYTTLARHALIE